MNCNKLLGLIKEHRYTLKDVADKLGISLSTFRRKLYTTGEFTREEINQLSEILGMDSDTLIDIFFSK